MITEPLTLDETYPNEGTIHVPPFTIPYSSLASPEAKAAFSEQVRRMQAMSLNGPSKFDFSNLDMTAIRSAVEDSIGSILANLEALYHVTVAHKVIGGVSVDSFSPRDGVSPKNKKRILINLHGGGFIAGGQAQRAAESAPIAAIGNIEVLSVDYRLGPENKFPAASEDVAAVYEELLSDYEPREIGIYGSSAGGLLTAEVMGWFDRQGLPRPGAIGVLCASVGPLSVGDSNYLAPHLSGSSPSGFPEGGFGPMGLYFGDADPKDIMVYPSNSPSLLASFPPTLLLTGTRSMELSGATKSHIQLVRLGVDAELYVWDGMWHGFFVDPTLPEAREACEMIVDFFNRRLG